VGGQLLRHVFDDCHRVEKETAKRAEEKQRRKEARQQDDTKPETDEEDEDEDESKVRKRNISISSRAHYATHTTALVHARFARCVASCVRRQCGSAKSTSTSPPRADGRWNSTSDTASR
jgi:UTP:GlnB (protein PII) uridylyltransferase